MDFEVHYTRKGDAYIPEFRRNAVVANFVKMPKAKSVFASQFSPTERMSGTLQVTAADIQRTPPEIRNPLLNITNFYLPQDLKVLNQWLRYFDRFHPFVGAALDLHAQVPMTRFEIGGVSDRYIQEFYENMCESIDIFQRSIEIAREWHLIGEVFPFSKWDNDLNCFVQTVIINPDYVWVSGHPFAYDRNFADQFMVFEIEADAELNRIVRSQDPIDLQIKSKIDPKILTSIEMTGRIPVDSFNMAQLAHRASPYDIRGTSIVLRCLKDLLYEDKLREAQYAIADAHVTPRWVYKLGDPQNGYMPSEEDLEDFRQLLINGAHDPNFAIITHYGLQIDVIGSSGKLLPIIPEMQWIADRILTALMTNKALLLGEGPNYATASVGMRSFYARSMAVRDMIENYWIKKIFVPVAVENKFWKITDAEIQHRVRVKDKQEVELMIPQFNWYDKNNLYDDNELKRMLLQMREKMQIPMKVLCRYLGLDYDEVKVWLIKEQGTVFDNLYWEQRKVKADTLLRQELQKQPSEQHFAASKVSESQIEQGDNGNKYGMYRLSQKTLEEERKFDEVAKELFLLKQLEEQGEIEVLGFEQEKQKVIEKYEKMGYIKRKEKGKVEDKKKIFGEKIVRNTYKVVVDVNQLSDDKSNGSDIKNIDFISELNKIMNQNEVWKKKVNKVSFVEE